jgi:ABC-2 type transport system permease protein
MTALTTHLGFEFKTGLRNPSALLLNYLFPLAFYGLMGMVMTKVNPGFTQTLMPAMVIFAAMSSGVLGLPSPQVELREAGVFRSFKINGVPAPAILGLPTLTSALHILIVSVIIMLTASSLFGAVVPTNWAAFLGVTLVTVFTLCSFGALIGVVSANSRATVLWSQLIFLPSMLLGGLMMPLSALPESILPFAKLLPTAYAMQAYQGLAFGQPTVMNATGSLVLLLASGVLAFGLAAYLFNWDSRNGTRRGHPAMGLLVLLPYVLGMFLG